MWFPPSATTTDGNRGFGRQQVCGKKTAKTRGVFPCRIFGIEFSTGKSAEIFFRREITHGSAGKNRPAARKKRARDEPRWTQRTGKRDRSRAPGGARRGSITGLTLDLCGGPGAGQKKAPRKPGRPRGGIFREAMDQKLTFAPSWMRQRDCVLSIAKPAGSAV
jgi:hypothetical protein